MADRLIDFYLGLPASRPLPEGISMMNPYREQQVQEIVRNFFTRFYADSRPRTLLMGINPGRFGAGVTGITFTDPVRLEQVCGIRNDLHKRQELSSAFVYEVIGAFGGPQVFFSQFLMTAVCPLGFVMDGKNLNYYDRRDLMRSMEGFMVDSIKKQIGICGSARRIISLGGGKNYEYLARLNDRHQLASEIIPLPHPRWVMQYRYRSRDKYIRQYIKSLTS